VQAQVRVREALGRDAPRAQSPLTADGGFGAPIIW